ncbi:MAG: metallophosphoesterase [Deltaproteobacteria bacterium]
MRAFVVVALVLFTACGGGSSASGGDGGSTGGGDDTGGSGSGSGSGGMGSGTSTVTDLRFGIVGDTRPPNPGDTAGYPTAIITKIYQDIEATTPKLPFVISTGDYMFADTAAQVTAQLALYMTARNNYSGTQYPAMGNHECTGATASNCGTGNTDGMTANYTQFLSTMLAPVGMAAPYYTKNINAADNSWTAKFVFVACNAWSSAQGTWLTSELAKPTTYTFVIRHEGTNAVSQTSCSQSQTIIDAHPLTLLVVGHTHTYSHYSSSKEVVVGIGGAPLTSGTDYGYAVVARNADGTLTVTVYNYSSHAVIDTFKVTATGAAG